MSAYYLGLDGGGTKTAACILDSNRGEVGRGQGGPCNIATGPLESLRDSVVTATRRALESAGLSVETRFESVCAGVAGYTAKGRRAEFHQLLTESMRANRHRLEPDFVIAYWGATEGKPGIVVSVGTGAVVYGRNEAGTTCRWDGRGFILGDIGSAFHIGRMALAAAVGQGGYLESKRLADAIYDHTGAEDADDIVQWVYSDVNPAKISGVAPLVGQLAEARDSAAIRILQLAATGLRQSVRMTAIRLGMAEDTPIYAVGGLWRIGPTYTDAFCRADESWDWPDISLVQPAHDAAFGAALLSMQADVDA